MSFNILVTSLSLVFCGCGKNEYKKPDCQEWIKHSRCKRWGRLGYAILVAKIHHFQITFGNSTDPFSLNNTAVTCLHLPIKPATDDLWRRPQNTFVTWKYARCEVYVVVSHILSHYFIKQISRICISRCFAVEVVTLWNTKGFSREEMDEITFLTTERGK